MTTSKKPIVDEDDDDTEQSGTDRESDKLEKAVGKIADGLVKAIEDHAPRKYIPFGRQRINSPFHKFDPDNPQGKTRIRKLDRRYYQNNSPINVKRITDEDIELLKRLKTGVYIGKLITIKEFDSDFGPTVQIVYKSRTADQRQAVGSKVGSFTGMLKMIIAEIDAAPKVVLA